MKRYIVAKVSIANLIISSIAIINTAEDMLADKLVFVPNMLIIFTLSSFKTCFVVTLFNFLPFPITLVLMKGTACISYLQDRWSKYHMQNILSYQSVIGKTSP